MNEGETIDIIDVLVKSKKLIRLMVPDPDKRKKYVLQIDTRMIDRGDFDRLIDRLVPTKHKHPGDPIENESIVFIEPQEMFGFYLKGD
jgi:hypothetical protein